MKTLLDHLARFNEVLLKYSEAIGNASHPVNLGSGRESLISNFLEQNLPEYIRYYTGELTDSYETRSGQIDIILHPITSPKFNLFGAINIFPAETVLAAIEVKSNLTTGKKNNALGKSLISCSRVKGLSITRPAQQESLPSTPDTVTFIIFAFRGPELKTIIKHFKEGSKNLQNPKLLPDLIVVLNKGYYLAKTESWKYADFTIDTLYRVNENKEAVLLGLYEFILMLVERSFRHPGFHSMPIEKYARDENNLNLFDFAEP